MKQRNRLIIFIIILLIISFVFVIYNRSSDKHQLLLDSKYFNNPNVLVNNKIQLVSNQNSYEKNDIISLFIVNQTENKYSFGEDYTLEMFYKNKWNYVSPDNGLQLIDLVVYHIFPKSKTMSFDIKLSKNYSNILSGTYRIYKEIEDANGNCNVIFVEFILK